MWSSQDHTSQTACYSLAYSAVLKYTHIMGCVLCHVLIAHLSSLPVHSYTYTYVHVHTSNLLLPSLPSPPFHPSLPSPPSLPQKCVVLSLTDTVWAAKQVVLDKLNQVLTHIAM